MFWSLSYELHILILSFSTRDVDGIWYEKSPCLFFSASEFCVLVKKWLVIYLLHVDVVLASLQVLAELQEGLGESRIDNLFYVLRDRSFEVIWHESKTRASLARFAISRDLLALAVEAGDSLSHFSLAFDLLAFVQALF